MQQSSPPFYVTYTTAILYYIMNKKAIKKPQIFAVFKRFFGSIQTSVLLNSGVQYSHEGMLGRGLLVS
jgi:hypothetical protein